MKKYKILNVIIFAMVFAFIITTVPAGAATYVPYDAIDADGNITSISKKSVTYRRQKGSDPVSYAKKKTLKINSKTKFYKCMGYNSSYTKWKLKKVSKAKAIKAIKENEGNYAYFIVDGKKLKKIIYGLENFVA